MSLRLSSIKKVKVFGTHFVKTGIFDQKYHRWLLSGFKRRIVGDYGVEIDFTTGEVAEMIMQAREFLKAGRQFIEGASEEDR